MITTLETTHHLDLQASSETAPASIQNRHKSRLSEAFAPLESGLRDSIWAAHAIGLAVFMAMVTVFVLWGATRLEQPLAWITIKACLVSYLWVYWTF